MSCIIFISCVPYIDVGIEVFDSDGAKPEYTAPSPAAIIEAGYSFYPEGLESIDVGIFHRSSIRHREKGNGINGISVRARIRP